MSELPVMPNSKPVDGEDWGQYIPELISYLSLPKPLVNHRELIWSLLFISMGLSVVCVLFRLYVRVMVARSPGLDDVFVAFYLMSTTVFTVTVGLLPNNGLGMHMIQMDLDLIERFAQLVYLANAAYVSSTALIKLALVFQYLRLYERKSRLWWCCVVTAVVLALWGFVFAFMAWFPCFPVHMYWEFGPGGRRGCYGFGLVFHRTAYVAHTATNMIMDAVVLLLPVPLCFREKATSRIKVGTLFILILGVMANVFNIWRMIIMEEIERTPAKNIDSAWFQVPVFLLAAGEISMASICASVPIFWPVLLQHFQHIFVTHEIEVVYEERLEIIDDSNKSQENFLGGDSERALFNRSYGNPFDRLAVETRVHSDSIP